MNRYSLYDDRMYLAIVRRYDDERRPSEHGKAHAAWWDGGDDYWLVCGTNVQDSLFVEVDEPESPHYSEAGVTCKKCLRLKLSHFRRVKKHIERWQAE